MGAGGTGVRFISFMSHHPLCKAEGELGSSGWVWYPEFRGKRGISFEASQQDTSVRYKNAASCFYSCPRRKEVQCHIYKNQCRAMKITLKAGFEDLDSHSFGATHSSHKPGPVTSPCWTSDLFAK